MKSRNFSQIKLSIPYYAPLDATLHCRVFESTDADGFVDYLMECKQDGLWTLEALLPIPDRKKAFYLRFLVLKGDEILDEEVANFFHELPCQTNKVSVKCLWNTSDDKAYRYSSAFTECLAEDITDEDASALATSANMAFINNYLPPKNKVLLITGSKRELGEWDASKAVAVKQRGTTSYCVDLPETSFEYKFILKDKETGAITWEEGNNRICNFQKGEESHFVEILPRLPQENPRVAGVVIPVFSLRSEESWGVGDFGDLRKMIDWASSCGLHVLQLLPVNDTTRDGSWMDSYPYNAISAFALHPMYANLSQLDALKDAGKAKRYKEESVRLNRLPQMDYEAVNRLKNEYLKTYFEEHKDEILIDDCLKLFLKKNKEWLFAYSAYRVLQEVNGTADFRMWKDFSTYNEGKIKSWLRENKLEDLFWFYVWVQFVLDKQLKQAHEYARSKGVILKGDIPIGVSRDSATAWLNGRYFNFDSQAGAPPDYFSETGQNWGFPTYNWTEILHDGGSWWKLRLSKMAEYFDAYRIDHVLGFFRIWEIPYDCIYGTLGHFNPALPLTEKEIRDFGFADSPDLFTRPVISKDDMRQRFGDAFGMVKIRFFDETVKNSGLYTVKSQYISQRQIVAETAEGKVRDELLRVLTEVLFIKDAKYPDKYHLNVAAGKTKVYQNLSPANREAYNRLSDYFFFHRHDAFWTEGAMCKLPLLLKSSKMLSCAEDLGMIPECMRTVLGKLHILSLEVESMPKYSWGRFADLNLNPYLSVDTITTHDMAPLRLWWKENMEAAKDYFYNVLRHEGECPYDMPAALACEVVRRHLQSPSLLCVIALQDWMAIDANLRNPQTNEEQINKPAVSRHYWRYRMHITIEKLQKSEFCNTVRQLVNESNR